jgi:hypothetical protein
MTPSHPSCQTSSGTHAMGQARTTGDLRKGPPKRGRYGSSRGVLAVPTPTASHPNDTQGTGRDSDILATRPVSCLRLHPNSHSRPPKVTRNGIPQYRPSPTTNHVRRRRSYQPTAGPSTPRQDNTPPPDHQKRPFSGVVSAGLPPRLPASSQATTQAGTRRWGEASAPAEAGCLTPASTLGPPSRMQATRLGATAQVTSMHVTT